MAQTLVLIHGYGFDNRIWNPVELAFEGFRVISLSLPGFSDKPVTKEYSIRELAVRFWEDIDQQNISSLHLAGMSMGGYVMMEMVAQQPSRILSVALVHSHVFADSIAKKEARTASMEAIRQHGRAGLVRPMISSLFAHAAKHQEIIEKLVMRGMSYDDHAWYWGMQAIRDRADHAQTLSILNVPVLMMVGDQDRAVPLDIVYRQASLAERVHLHILPDTGHLGMYENTAQMIAVFVRFYQWCRL